MPTFDVKPRFVGTNPTDPDGLRRSQRRIVNAVEDFQLVAANGPTGSGKTHTNKHISEKNAAKVNPKWMFVLSPVKALVTQQAHEISAMFLEPMEQLYTKIWHEADLDPKGRWAHLRTEFERDCRIPMEIRSSAQFLAIISGDPKVPMALTPDSFYLAIRGVLAAAAGPLDLAVIRKIVQSYIRSKRMQAQVEAAAVGILTPPSNIGVKTRKRLEAWTIKAIPDKSLSPERREAMVTELMAASTPKVMTGGPKYFFTREQADTIKAQMNGALVVFDEYHILAHYKENTTRLINWLLEMGSKVLLMSGTPRKDLTDQWPDLVTVNFDQEESLDRLPADEPTVAFNHPMSVEVQYLGFSSSRTYDAVSTVLPYIKRWDKEAPGPAMLIFEAVDRAITVQEALEGNPLTRGRAIMWTGDYKDPKLNAVLKKQATLADDAIIVGTSALEIGIDLPVRNMFTEVKYLDSALQRVGRVGRMGSRTPGEVHNAVIALNKTFVPATAVFPTEPIERVDLPATLASLMGIKDHQKALTYPGMWLRGDRKFQFTTIIPPQDGQGWRIIQNCEVLLRRYPPSAGGVVSNWAFLTPAKRRDALRALGIPKEIVSRIMFGELYSPSSVAYVSENMERLKGAIKEEDKEEGFHTDRLLRTWSIQGRPVLSAWVRIPKRRRKTPVAV